MNKNYVAGISALLLLVIGAGWAMGFFDRTDPQLAELEKMRDENFEKIKDMSDEQRRKQYSSFRDKVRDLSDEQRRQFFENSRPMFQQMQVQRMNEFFAKSPDEQNKELDKLIDRSEEWRKARESRPDNGGDREGRGDRGGWRDMSPQQQDQRRKQRLDASTPDMRAKMDRFRDMMRKRRAERGLDPDGGWGRFGGRS